MRIGGFCKRSALKDRALSRPERTNSTGHHNVLPIEGPIYCHLKPHTHLQSLFLINIQIMHNLKLLLFFDSNVLCCFLKSGKSCWLVLTIDIHISALDRRQSAHYRNHVSVTYKFALIYIVFQKQVFF